MIVRHDLWWASPTQYFLAADVNFTKVEERRRSLVVTREEIAKFWPQINHERRTKHTTLCSLAYEPEGCVGHPGYLASPEGHVNRIISHQFTAGKGTHALHCCLGARHLDG